MENHSVSLKKILHCYGQLLSTVDQWFSASIASKGADIQCCSGCSSCCRGLFDITLLDALYLRQGFERLDVATKQSVLARVERQMEKLRHEWQDMAPPYIINTIPEDNWERLMPEDDPTPCALLGENGRCLVYENRPMTCRLHGISLVDVSGEIFHDEWCTRNFKNCDPLEEECLRWEFRACFQDELVLFQQLATLLLNQKINELDTFIPLALVMDWDCFDWLGWWKGNSELIRNAGFPECPR